MAACHIDHKTLYEDLHQLAPNWNMFGVYLGVPYDKLQGLRGEASMVDRCFVDVLSAWLNRGNASVDRLVAALRFPGVNKGRLAGEINRDRHNVKLKLPYLIVKLSPCKSCWFQLGLALGIPTEELRKFESERRSPGVVLCLQDTLRLWLDSEDADLDTLVDAIEQCGHKSLSKEIKAKYQDCDFSSLISVSSQSTTTSSSYVPPSSRPTPVSATVTHQQITTTERRHTSATMSLTTTNTQASHMDRQCASYDTTDTDNLSDMSKPTSANVALIKWRNPQGEVKKFRLITSIMHRWQEVGNMVVPRQQLEVWSKRMEDKDCCRAMLFYWLDNPPRNYPATWEGLYELLDDCELSEIARKLKFAVENTI